jgi:hypothetical protein
LESRALPSLFTDDRHTDYGEGKGQAGDLRYCLTQANDRDQVIFSVTGTINLVQALPDLTRSIAIEGPGAEFLTVRRGSGGFYRIFTVDSGATVSISGLALTNGYIHQDPEQGGAIYNAGQLTISDSVILRNTVEGSSFDGAYGGGIYNAGEMTVRYSSIYGNFTRDETYPGAFGAGIYNAGEMTLENSVLSQNVVFNLEENAFGSGIYNAGLLTMNNSTLSGNGSNAEAGLGGGIYNQGTLRVAHSTISHNEASLGGGIYGGVREMRDTILAGNRGGSLPDLGGHVDSSGYNLIGNTQGASGFNDTDLLNVNPMLGPLQDNGGPTPTHALLPGSPAIDAGDNAGAPEWDQRGPGFPRIVNDVIDIGAFEVQAENVAARPHRGLSSSVVDPLSATQAPRAPASLPVTQQSDASNSLGVAQVPTAPDVPTIACDYFWIGEGTLPDQAWWQWDPANSF